MKIICIGRNYVEHIKELKNEIPDEPVVFIKPESTLIRNNKPFFHPGFSKCIDYELELVLKISKLGKHIQKKFAHTYYNEIGLGIDFTARDLQEKFRKKGLPWEKAKSFDGSAPISNFLPKEKILDLNNINFKLLINNKTVQKGNSSFMINDFDSIISHISQFFTLKIGDLIFTGTPAGVGKINLEDRLEGFLEEEKLLNFKVK